MLQYMTRIVRDTARITARKKEKNTHIWMLQELLEFGKVCLFKHNIHIHMHMPVYLNTHPGERNSMIAYLKWITACRQYIFSIQNSH